jgi:hypothetical protein
MDHDENAKFHVMVQIFERREKFFEHLLDLLIEKRAKLHLLQILKRVQIPLFFRSIDRADVL